MGDIHILRRVATAAVVLRFDGSLRTNPFSSGAVAASCAAAVLHNNDQSIHAVGGRSLSTNVVPGLTSGEAEYFGLLLGLECISNALQEQGDQVIGIDKLWRQEITLDDVASAPALTIRGDCKTVIDHCQGCAVPRKLRPQYEMTIQQIEDIQNHVRVGLGKELLVSFEHVKRENNELCDAMCKLITRCKEEGIVSSIERGIDEARVIAVSSTIALPNALKKRRKFLESPFVEPLDRISSRDGIGVSNRKRLALYRKLARAVLESHDAVALRLLGGKLRLEAKDVAVSCHCEDDLSTVGLLFELCGLRKMELLEEAERFERKHKHVLRQYAGYELDIISTFAQRTTTVTLHDDAEEIITAIDDGSNLVKDWYQQIHSGNIEAGVWVHYNVQMTNSWKENR